MRKIENNNQVVIGNRNSGHWIKVTKQCYDVLYIGMKENLTVLELISKSADEADKKYFKKLIGTMEKLDVLKNKDEKELSAIQQIDFAITNRCNLNCIHCCVDAGTVDNIDILSTDEVKNIIDKIVTYNPKGINFTGGEPLLRKDFIDI